MKEEHRVLWYASDGLNGKIGCLGKPPIAVIIFRSAMSEVIEQPLPRTFEEFNEQRKAAFIRVKDYKQAGNRLIGFLCSYTPLEIIDAAGLRAWRCAARPTR